MGHDVRMGHTEAAGHGVLGPGVATLDLAGARSIEDVAATTFRALVDSYGASRAGLALTMPGGRQLRFISSDVTLGGGAPAWCLIDAYDDLPLNDAVRTGQDVVLPTRQSLVDAYPELGSRQQPGTKGVVALVLATRGRRLGGLIVYLDDEVDWSRDGPRLKALAAGVTDALVAVGAGPPTDSGSPQGCGLPADETAAGLARRFLRQRLGGWGVDEDVTYSAILCASEIVTNVVMHAACPSVISADRSPAAITVTIEHSTTAGTDQPSARVDPDPASDPLGIAGRGLAIVDAVAAEWGTGTVGDRTRWWFRLR